MGMASYWDISWQINGLESQRASLQTHTDHYFPCAMVLRLMPCSPRRGIRLVTVAAGLMADTIRLDRSRHRQLGTSNGCRDHTVLPYATNPSSPKASPGFVQVRRSFVEGESSAVRPARRLSLTSLARPAITLRADAVASTASHPAFVTTRDPPLLPGWDGASW
jgi:hypothetical protein